jgi:hypothetical protein
VVAHADHSDHRPFGINPDFRANIAFSTVYLYGILKALSCEL